MLGAVNVLDCPAWMSPVSNAPALLVKVWVTLSSLVTVTTVPGATVVLLGEKAKFLMVMAWPPPPADDPDPVWVELEAVLPPDEHAASTMAAPTRHKSEIRRTDRNDGVVTRCFVGSSTRGEMRNMPLIRSRAQSGCRANRNWCHRACQARTDWLVQVR